jgi:cobalamin biosynthesis protein CobT
MSQFEKPEIIVIEPSGQQKRFILKPHGDLEIIKKKWRSHLRNIGARWVDKQSHWTIAKDNLKDFEKLQKIMDSGEDPKQENKKNDETSGRPRNKKNEKKKKEESESEEDDEQEDSDDGDIQLIEYLKDKIKTSRSSHPEIDTYMIDESDHEDVVSICRRIRYLYKILQSMRSEIKNLQEENAFLYRTVERLEKKL